MDRLTKGELFALLRVVMSAQAEVMLGRLNAQPVRHLAEAFDAFGELAGIESYDARVIQGLERLNHRLRLQLGEMVGAEEAQPLQ
ncbi:hypothetical protein [Micromonospora sp. WMMD1082]|uniref:hypothetical protein n=1 Tax=Micromonospora sp. WMMD1082 TaxID=3016104 RepID=UPI0024179ABC|nr:hypothetical protein [Micromonospora sp. WMMD1082]MDG4793749.1 hypothetical protein [Micromonospora sp. WMMD1082]